MATLKVGLMSKEKLEDLVLSLKLNIWALEGGRVEESITTLNVQCAEVWK